MRVPQPARALCGAKFDLIRFVRSVCRICYGSCRRTPSFVLDLVDAGLPSTERDLSSSRSKGCCASRRRSVNNQPAHPEASVSQTAAPTASVARVLAPLCCPAGLQTLTVLF
jgi:hypothetical protein